MIHDNDDHRELQDADAVHEQISKDNDELRSSETVKEKTFNIRIRHPICEMRKDTQLVLTDIPGINEAESSKKYRDYVESNWSTFDCVVVVMDAMQGVNTEEQVELLRFVENNNRISKDIPTIVLGNKVDDPNDEDTIHLIEEIRSKTIEVFGNVDYKSMPQNAGEKEEAKTRENKANKGAAKRAFIPLSAKNAFIYMKAGNFVLNQLHTYSDLVNLDLLNKIGCNEFGLRWSRMKDDEKVDSVLKIMQDPSEINERLAGTNFNSFLSVLSDFVGGHGSQRNILAKKVEVALNAICYRSLGENAISKCISEAFSRSQSIGTTDVDCLQKTFWKAYRDCEKESFEERLEKCVDPTALERPFMELESYYELTLKLGWTEESMRVKDAMEQLLRRQITFLLKKFEKWSFGSYCRSAGAQKMRGKHVRVCNNCYPDESGEYCCALVRGENSRYFICGENHFVEWMECVPPKESTWDKLSPKECILILESISLIWNQSCFIENFGPEKVKLQRMLMDFNCAFGSFLGINFDVCMTTSSRFNLLYLYAYRDLDFEDSTPFEAKLEMPNSLVDPSHWGFLAWKYINFSSGLLDRGGKKRKVGRSIV
jgi:GTPase SAR1 family protein